MNPLCDIRAVTFDVGGTLIEPWPSVGHVYVEIAGKHGVKNLTPDLMNERFAAAWQGRNSPIHTAAEWAAVVDQTFAGLVTEPPSRTFFRELYGQFALPSAWRIYDDVEPALKSLRARGFRLGVISNWDERLRPLLRGLGLAERFEEIVVSCEVGFAKPAPEIFQHAAEKLGLPPQRILHVGDSLEMDAIGARAAGFRAMQVVHRGGALEPGQIRSLQDIAMSVPETRG